MSAAPASSPGGGVDLRLNSSELAHLMRGVALRITQQSGFISRISPDKVDMLARAYETMDELDKLFGRLARADGGR